MGRGEGDDCVGGGAAWTSSEDNLSARDRFSGVASTELFLLIYFSLSFSPTL